MYFEAKLGEGFEDEGGSFDEIIYGKEDEGSIIGIKSIFVVKGDAFLLGSLVEIAVGEVGGKL